MKAGEHRQVVVSVPCYYGAREIPGRNTQPREASGVSGTAIRQDKQGQQGGYEDGLNTKRHREADADCGWANSRH